MLQINIELHLRNIQYTVVLNFLIILKETICLIYYWTSSEESLSSSNSILLLTWLSSCLRKKLFGCQGKESKIWKLGWDGDDYELYLELVGPIFPSPLSYMIVLISDIQRWSLAQAIRNNRINLRGGKTHLDLATLHASCISISDFWLLLPKSHPDSFHLNRFKFQQQNYSARLRQRSAARRGRRGSQLISWTVLDSLWYCPLPLHICRPRTDNEVRQTQRGPSGNSPVPAKTGLLWLDLNSWSDKFSGHSTLLPPAAAADVRTFETSCRATI